MHSTDTPTQQPDRDVVVTVAIGAETESGMLTDAELSAASYEIKRALKDSGAVVVAHTFGEGLASDGDRLGTVERTAVLLAVNPIPNRVDALRLHIAQTLRTFGMSSACFAVDGYHEPVFDTRNGDRPTV